MAWSPERRMLFLSDIDIECIVIIVVIMNMARYLQMQSYLDSRYVIYFECTVWMDFLQLRERAPCFASWKKKNGWMMKVKRSTTWLLNVQGISTILQIARAWHVENEESQWWMVKWWNEYRSYTESKDTRSWQACKSQRGRGKDNASEVVPEMDRCLGVSVHGA